MMADGKLHVEFFHRHPKRLKDANILTIVSTGIASDGLVVDRLREVMALRLNRSYWHYIVPVTRVTA